MILVSRRPILDYPCLIDFCRLSPRPHGRGDSYDPWHHPRVCVGWPYSCFPFRHWRRNLINDINEVNKQIWNTNDFKGQLQLVLLTKTKIEPLNKKMNWLMMQAWRHYRCLRKGPTSQFHPPPQVNVFTPETFLFFIKLSFYGIFLIKYLHWEKLP